MLLACDMRSCAARSSNDRFRPHAYGHGTWRFSRGEHARLGARAALALVESAGRCRRHRWHSLFTM